MSVDVTRTLPDCLETTAWARSPDGSPDEITGVRHQGLPVQGVQFHAESILSEHGHDILRSLIEGK